MPQSLAQVLAHLVFSTKNRKPFLIDKSIRNDLYSYTAKIFKEVDSPTLLINGTEDHIHILFSMSRNFAIREIVQTIKKKPSKWIKQFGAEYENFHWQSGYGIFSVSPSNIDQVKKYIQNQEEHHKKWTFKEEFRELCRRHGVEIDERYVWD